MSKELEALNNLNCEDIVYVHKDYWNEIQKKLKTLEIIKENLVVSYDESENDKPCLMIGIKVNKDNLIVIYETFDKEKIDVLKEVLL